MLPTREEREQYALALGYEQSEFIGSSSRNKILSELQTSYDTLVVTGPIARTFWSLVSLEVFVRVEPDGYDYTYRTENVKEWSLYATGLSERDVRALLSLPSAPTRRHHLYDKYVAAQELERQLFQLHAHVATLKRPTVQEAERLLGVTIVKSPDEQLKLLEDLKTHPDEVVALDFEWVIDDTVQCGQELIAVNVAVLNEAWYLPLRARGIDLREHTDSLRRAVFNLVRDRRTVFHNAKADFGQYTSDPLDLFGYPIEDTILMAYVAGEQKLGLKDLAESLLGRKAVKLPPDLENQPVELAARYGTADAKNTLDLYYLLKKKLEDTGQWEVYSEIERPLVPIVASMERYGMPLDMVEVQRLYDFYYDKEEEIRNAILNQTGLDFSEDKQQLQYCKLNGFNTNSLDKRTLSRITYPWVSPLLEYRETRTLRRNFLGKHLDTWRRLGEPQDYRVYPTFNQAGRDTESGSWLNAPATGRFSSAGPNLQNQPRAIRSAFVAPAGYAVVSLDYSALELRVAAAVSKDPVMLDTLKAGGDLHQLMREMILDRTGVDVGRPTAKTANFNLRYEGQADMLITIAAKQGAHLSFDLAEKIVEVDRQTYTGYWRWWDATIEEAVRKGWSATLRGRRRYNGNLSSQDSLKQGHAKRAAGNMVVQGTAADIIKSAMGKIPAILRYFKAHLALQVHDELVFWVPTEYAERFTIAVKGVMESIDLPELTLAVEGTHGDNWGEAH